MSRAACYNPDHPDVAREATRVRRNNVLGWSATTIDVGFLAKLRCPASHTPLVQDGEWLYACDPVGRRKYPIRDGIPVLLIDEAVVAPVEEFERVTALRTPAAAEGG